MAPYRHVCIAAERAFLHVAVTDFQVTYERVNLARIGHGFFRAAHVGFGHDFEQRRAGAVQIDTAHIRELVVDRFAGVFLEVRAGNAYFLVFALGRADKDMAAADDRQLVLRNLVTLGQIGVEIILARKNRVMIDFGFDGNAEADRHADRFAVQHRQHARQAEIDRAGLGVRFGAKRGRRTGEYFTFGRELRVNLEPDDAFPFAHLNASGTRKCQSLTCW